ncbi:hypothetical protein KI387_028237, partial [Taxus chinensis]
MLSISKESLASIRQFVVTSANTQVQYLLSHAINHSIQESKLATHSLKIRTYLNMFAFISAAITYTKFVKPAYDEFILPSKKYADIIIPRGGDNYVAIDLIVQHIRTKLDEHDLCKIYPNLYVVNSTFQIKGMHTLIRDINTTKHDFVFYADRLIRLVVEHGLGHLSFTERQVITPTGSVYTGVEFCKTLCGVSIIH